MRACDLKKMILSNHIIKKIFLYVLEISIHIPYLKIYSLKLYYYFRTNSDVSQKVLNDIQFIKYLNQHRNIAVDVGANYGLYTYPLSKLYNKVIAIEPNKEVTKYIRNSTGNIDVYNIALSDKIGMKYINIPIYKKTPLFGLSSISNYVNYIYKDEFSIEKRNINVNSLDNLCINNVDFIKIDVEGHEYEVLKGAEKLIKRDKPIILIEIEQRFYYDLLIAEIFNWLISHEYEGFYIYNRRLLPLKKFDTYRNQTAYLNSNGKITNIHHYVNNFFFINVKDINHKLLKMVDTVVV